MQVKNGLGLLSGRSDGVEIWERKGKERGIIILLLLLHRIGTDGPGGEGRWWAMEFLPSTASFIICYIHRVVNNWGIVEGKLKSFMIFTFSLSHIPHGAIKSSINPCDAQKKTQKIIYPYLAPFPLFFRAQRSH